MQEEESEIEAKVQARLASILAEHQMTFAATMEQAMQGALAGIDQGRAAVEEERDRLQAELDAVRALHAQAEREGEAMSSAAFEKHQREYTETIRTTLLRDLTRLHIEGGKTTNEIMKWLEVDRKFVERIREVVNRVKRYRGEDRTGSGKGDPRIRCVDEGRSGLLYFESSEGSFDTWWEMGYGALAIVAVPPAETWERDTGLPRERRLEILNFIAEELVRLQAPEGYFIVGENVITIYEN